MKKHTPGPWKVVRHSKGHHIGIAWREIITETHGPYGGAYVAEALERDAHLIASAPELLEAVKKCLTRFGDEIGSTQYEELRELIAKAEGTNE